MMALPVGALLQQVSNVNPLILWQDDYLRRRWVWSLIQATVTCLVTLGIGVPMAWVLARFDFPGRSFWIRWMMLPFVVPTLVAALGVLALLGPQSILNQWISQRMGWQLEESPALLLYGNVFFNTCLVVRAGMEGLARVSASRVEAARTLGATRWRAFWRVEWPVMLPWLCSALCLVFLYCFSGFGLALVLGGSAWSTVDVEIYTLVAHELQLEDAASLALWTTLTTSLLAVVYAYLERRLALSSRADSIQLQTVQTFTQSLYIAVMALTLLIISAPLIALLWHGLKALWATPSLVINIDVIQAMGRTLLYATVAVIGSTILGTLHALASQRSLLMRSMTYLPLVVSPVIVSFGLLLAYPNASATLTVMLSTYVLLATPFVSKSVTAALDSLPPQVIDVARTLGASRWRTFWRVVIPLCLPSLRHGMAFAAATAIGEFAATLFLSRPEWTTLTTLVYQYLGRPGVGNLDMAMVLALLLMLLSVGVMQLIEGRRHA